MAIEKIKILGAVLELPAKQHCQSSPFTSKLGQIGQIGSAVYLVAPKWLPGSIFLVYYFGLSQCASYIFKNMRLNTFKSISTYQTLFKCDELASHF